MPRPNSIAVTTSPRRASHGWSRVRHESLSKRDGNANAPDDVERQDEDGPPRAHPEPRDVGVVQEMKVQLEVVRVEQRLRGERFFEDLYARPRTRIDGQPRPTRRTDSRMSRAPPPYMGASTISRRKRGNRQIAKEELRDEWTQEKERECRRNALHQFPS